LARTLLTRICTDAESIGLRHLHCLSTLLTAAPFYAAMGFTRLDLSASLSRLESISLR
jgi:N-acetylglutamate synthase-like GNAT family acetyltransferase